MRRIFSSFLLFVVMTTHSIANTAVETNLKAAFDKLTFELSQVNGKDPAVNKQIMDEFFGTVKELRAQGLTDEALLEYAKDNMPNEAMKTELESILLQVEINALSQGEAQKLVMDAVKKGNATGSNYVGSSGAMVAGALVLVLLIVLLASAGGCEDGTYEEYVCDDYYDAYGYYLYSDCYYDTFCY